VARGRHPVVMGNHDPYSHILKVSKATLVESRAWIDCLYPKPRATSAAVDYFRLGNPES
jgi:hypothetical protein